MKQLLQSSRRALALSTMLILTACAHSPGSPESVSVQIPRDCEQLAATVPLPALARGQNAKGALAQHRGALIRANGVIDATRECQVNQRERFAKGGQP